MGWLLILIVPLTYPSLLIIVPSTLIPVTSGRFGFVALLGIVSSNYSDINIKKIFKLRFVKIFLIFSAILIVSSLRDSPKYVLATYLLDAWFGIGLGFVMIKSPKDLDKLFKIMVWQSAIIGLLIIVEYYTSFNWVLFLRNSLHQIDVSKTNSSYIRSGVYRPMGIDGNSVQTAYRLVFLFPLTLWYSLRGKFLNFIPLILVSIGLIFLQTRAAFISLAFSMLVLIFLVAFSKKDRKMRKRLFKIFFSAILFLGLGLFIFSGIYHIVVHFFSGFLGTDTELSVGHDTRDLFIFIALRHIISSPIWGYGSPGYVYNTLMNAMDLPAPILYFLSGGIILFVVYLYQLYFLSTSLLRYIKKLIVNRDLEYKALFVSIGLIAGNAVLFFNWQENHIMIMYMVYIAVVKQIFVLNKAI